MLKKHLYIAFILFFSTAYATQKKQEKQQEIVKIIAKKQQFEKCLESKDLTKFFKKKYGDDKATIFHLLATHDLTGDSTRHVFDLIIKQGIDVPLNTLTTPSKNHFVHLAVKHDNLFFITELVRYRAKCKELKLKNNSLRLNVKNKASQTPHDMVPKKALYGSSIIALLITIGLKKG